MGHSYLEQSVATHGGLSAEPSSYLHPPELVPTGVPLADQGTACDPMDPAHEAAWRHYVTDDCFLAPSQRRTMVATLQQRIGDAHDAYVDALQSLRMEQLSKHDSNPSWFFDLLLDVIGLAAIASIIRGYRVLESSGVLAQHGLSEVAAKEQRAKTEARITAIGKPAVSNTKKQLGKPHDPASDATSANVSFIDILKDRAQVTYQHFRELAPASSNDVELLALAEAFKAEQGHAPSDYKTQLAQRLKEFEESDVGELGVQWSDRHEPGPMRDLAKIETKAVLVRVPGNTRVALYRREHIDGMEAGDWHASLFDTHVVSPEESVRRKAADLERRPFHFDRFVPDDLKDIAIQMHRARWGEEPKEQDAGPDELVAQMGGSR